MNKYGREHFYYEVLEEGIADADELDAREEFYIAKFNSLRPNGYNLCPGGKQWRNSDKANVQVDMTLVEDYLSGLSLADVAQKHGCSKSKVKYHVLHSGNALRPRINPNRRDASVLTKELLTDLFIRQGMKNDEIAEMYHFHPTYVRNRRRKYNIHRI